VAAKAISLPNSVVLRLDLAASWWLALGCIWTGSGLAAAAALA